MSCKSVSRTVRAKTGTRRGVRGRNQHKQCRRAGGSTKPQNLEASRHSCPMFPKLSLAVLSCRGPSRAVATGTTNIYWWTMVDLAFESWPPGIGKLALQLQDLVLPLNRLEGSLGHQVCCTPMYRCGYIQILYAHAEHVCTYVYRYTYRER